MSNPIPNKRPRELPHSPLDCFVVSHCHHVLPRDLLDGAGRPLLPRRNWRFPQLVHLWDVWQKPGTHTHKHANTHTNTHAHTRTHIYPHTHTHTESVGPEGKVIKEGCRSTIHTPATPQGSLIRQGSKDRKITIDQRLLTDTICKTAHSDSPVVQCPVAYSTAAPNEYHIKDKHESRI